MASDFFSDTASTVLSKALDGNAARQKAIANNIANLETPGYKRSYVSFEGELKRIVRQSRGHNLRAALKVFEPVRRTDEFSPARPDGNNVNIDAEISDLAKTGLTYRAESVLLESKAAMLRAAVTEGKK